MSYIGVIQIRHSTRDQSAKAISDLSPGCLIVFDRATGVQRALISPLPQHFHIYITNLLHLTAFPPPPRHLHKCAPVVLPSRRPHLHPCPTDTYPVRSPTGTSACTSPLTLTPTPSSPILPIPLPCTRPISTGAPPPSPQLPAASRTAPITPTHPPIRSFPPSSCLTCLRQMAWHPLPPA